MAEELQKYLMENIGEIRKLVTENNAEIRELKGELREFKEHVLGRVEKLEKKEGERTRHVFSALSLLVSAAALGFSVVFNFFKNGGK